MGEIQSAINQMLGSTAIVAGLAYNSPQAKEARLKRTLLNKEQTYNQVERDESIKYSQAMSDLSNEYLESDMSEEDLNARKKLLGEKRNRIMGETATKKADVYGQLFELTGEGKYLEQQKQQEDLANIRGGNTHMRVIGQQQLQQQFNFRNYLDSLSKKERAEVLRYGQHVQAISKRGGNV